MKRFLCILLFCTFLALCYVKLQAKIVFLSYNLKRLYQKKEKLMSEKQYYLAKLLDITSPENIKQQLLTRRIYLSYSSPRKVVCLTSKNNKSRGILGILFGESQAVADVLE